MANPQKGEVDFIVGAKTFTMKLGNNAKAEAERALNKPWAQIINELLNKRTSRADAARAVVWAGLHQRHPELSLLDVGDMIDEAGETYAGTCIGEAIKLMSPIGGAASPSQEPKSDPAGTSS